MVVLALALGYFAFDKFVLSPQREAEQVSTARKEGRTEALVESYGEKSIAVLPFVNMSSDPDQEYFSDGISEELLNLLAKIPELRVISRSSAFSYKGKDVKLAQVAEELNVAHILEGSVRKAGNKVRITAQLIEARSDTHLWSKTWDRELDDIFAVQDEIAARGGGATQDQAARAAPKAKEVESEGLCAVFCKARQLARQNMRESFQQAIALYPAGTRDRSRLRGGLGWVGRSLLHSGWRRLAPLEEGVRLAREAATKALTIDPDYRAGARPPRLHRDDLRRRHGNGGPALRARPCAGPGQQHCRPPGRESQPPGHGDRAFRICGHPRPAQHLQSWNPGLYLPQRRASGRRDRQFAYGVATGSGF